MTRARREESSRGAEIGKLDARLAGVIPYVRRSGASIRHCLALSTAALSDSADDNLNNDSVNDSESAYESSKQQQHRIRVWLG